MGHFGLCSVLLISVLFLLIQESFQHPWLNTGGLENHINPEDLLQLMKSLPNNDATKEKEDRRVRRATHWEAANPGIHQDSTDNSVSDIVDCFGPLTQHISEIIDMVPDSSDAVNTHFYFTSRKMTDRVQVLPGKFSLNSVDFEPNRKTVMIIHGFMSYSDADWVNDMARAFLRWDDVNVIAVDWSGGGKTFNYFKAVANTRRVGSDIVGFLHQMMAATGLRKKDVHIVGHSLGAHIASYASHRLGKVARITGLDPAQPCYMTTDPTVRLDATDADYVDIIHTNGQPLSELGLGIPDPVGHADFYPNGGMKQPGCKNDPDSWWTKVKSWISKIFDEDIDDLEKEGLLGKLLFSDLPTAICSHGRAYLLFTESLLSRDCTFKGHNWDLTYEGVNASLKVNCAKDGSCSEMGIGAIGASGVPPAKGTYLVLTTDKEPYCPTDWERRHPQPELLTDLENGFVLNGLLQKPTSKVSAVAWDHWYRNLSPRLRQDPGLGLFLIILIVVCYS